ncbi:hypothetical protein GCM10010166_62700 [Couchioplanes caeruleus subsp. azureus]|nr:hypothetical protein GCM10010166_62700 [Couchioplanes caeruleus subsp. azureus]
MGGVQHRGDGPLPSPTPTAGKWDASGAEVELLQLRAMSRKWAGRPLLCYQGARRLRSPALDGREEAGPGPKGWLEQRAATELGLNGREERRIGPISVSARRRRYGSPVLTAAKSPRSRPTR